MAVQTLPTLTDLLAAVERLPAGERDEVVAELTRVLELDEARRQLALGLLALDLAPRVAAAPAEPSGPSGSADPAPARPLEVRVHVPAVA